MPYLTNPYGFQIIHTQEGNKIPKHPLRCLLFHKALQVLTIFGFTEGFRMLGHQSVTDPALGIADLLGAAGLHALTDRQSTDKVARVQQAAVGAGVQPCVAAAHPLD